VGHMKTQSKNTRPTRGAKPKKPNKVRRAAKIMTEARLNKLVGSMAYLWKSDEDFESFLKEIDENRRQDI
jgi:hypothetical protein